MEGTTTKCYENRELSWLKFNERVLEEAENTSIPLCERLSFTSIYQSNLDEFFMVRVGSLIDQDLLDPKSRENKTRMTPKEQIAAILPRVEELNYRKDRAYRKIMGKLEKYGVKIVNFHKIQKKDSQYLRSYFEREVVPFLSPTVVGKRQPFPFMRNREIYVVAALEKKNGKTKMGIIPCGNSVLKRLIHLEGTDQYMLIEDMILHYVPVIFAGYRVKGKALIRITRNADIDADALFDEDLDYRDFMAELVKRRKRLAPLRLEVKGDLDGEIVEKLCDALELDRKLIFTSQAPLELSFVFQIQDILRKNPELFYEKRVPQKSASFESGKSILAQIKEGDKLLSYPYESINPFLGMLHEAARDKNVVSIKMTLYRVAKESKVVEALIEAAENGKDVLALVELKARFDEENNIEWSRRLEDAGCQVIYGLSGYKVHSKLCAITRKTEEGTEYYTQIGTGNYNEKTARLYTDYSLMTADPEIGKEAAEVFLALSKGETVKETSHLLVAPNCLKDKVLAMMDEEIQRAKNGEEAYMGFKMNSLTDKKIIDKLIEASSAGVRIDLVIRGINCLRPGVEKMTENITVRSIVGRYLEHSRIYLFGTKERRKVYIASADYMTRNTERRVEVAAPVYDPALKQRIEEEFGTMLRDNQKARLEDADGQYSIEPAQGEPVNAQASFYEKSYQMAEMAAKE